MKNIMLLALVLVLSGCGKKTLISEPTPTLIPSPTTTPIPTAVPTITPTPTPRPLSLSELNKLYGPCASVRVLMYHHIKDMEEAKVANQQNLTVAPDVFAQQMEYLKTNGYTVIGMDQLVDFFDGGVGLPDRAVIISLDDGYDDNYNQAFPILKEYGFKAVIFTTTGLLENPGYMKWEQVSEMAGSGLVYFANHTWSHHGSWGLLEDLAREIGTADGQLAERNLNNQKIFAYPFGDSNDTAKQVLSEMGYRIAFTTNPGSVVCAQKRFDLPRTRIGNSSLGAYGL